MSDQPPEATEAVPADGGPIYCRSCGAEMEPGAQFCSECGTPTKASGAEPTAVAPVVPAEPVRRTTVVDEPGPVVDEPMVVRSADNWWSGPFIFMAAAILVVLIVVLAVALSRDGPATPPTTTIVPVTVPTTVATTVVPVVPPPVVITPAPTAPPQTAPPQTAPPQTAPPQTTAAPSTTTTTAPA